MPNFPATLDTNGAGSLPTNHADGISEIIHASTIDDLATVAVAVETKVGSGASTPTSGLVLTGGSIPGTSTWQAPAGTTSSATTPAGLAPFSVGPWPQDDSGWTTNLIGHANPTLGIPRAPLLSTMAQNNQLHLPASIAACIESPPTSLQAQINATSSGGVCRVAPGYIYREAVTISNPITIVGLGRVSLRGSDDWSIGGISGCTWSLAAGVYTSSLTVPAMATDAVVGSPSNTYAQQHRETAFLDGIALQIANTATPTAGQFALDGSRHVILGINPSGHKVEVATRMVVITTSGEIALTIDGLDIRQVATSGTAQPTCIDTSSITTSAINLLNCMVGWCHGFGISTGGKTNLYIEGCIFHDVGVSGLTGYLNVNPVYYRNMFFNCGLAVYGWDNTSGSGGIKETNTVGGVIDQCVAFCCKLAGFWYDVYAVRSDMRSCVAWDCSFNYHYEISSFGVIKDCVSFRTPNMPGGLTVQNLGIYASSSRWVEVTGNLMMHSPINFKHIYVPTRNVPPLGAVDTTHMGGINFHDNLVIGRYHAADQSSQSDIAEQWADNGSGTYVNVASNVGANNQFGWPALINSGASYLEVQQEPDTRWLHDTGGGGGPVTTLAAWQAIQFSAASDKYMLDATRVAHLRRFGLIP